METLTEHNHPCDPDYSLEEIDFCLTVLATQGGRVSRALPILAGQNLKPSREQLAKWRDELHHARYHELQEEHADTIARRAAARSMEIAELAADGVEKFVTKAIEAADRIDAETPGDVRDLATSARNLSQVQVNSVEKSRLLRDEPTDVHSLESLDELVDVLRAAGVVRGDAIDAEHVEEETEALPAPPDGV